MTTAATPAMATKAALDGAALLALWEQALALAAPAREAWLANDGGARAPAATLGAQRARLLRALAPWCGGRLALKSRCPRCSEAVAFEVDPAALAAGHDDEAAAAPAAIELQAEGWQLRLRPLAPHDLEAALRAADGGNGGDGGHAADEEDAAFLNALLARCVLQARPSRQSVGEPLTADDPAALPAALPAAAVQRVAEALEAADPLASIAFDIACPACAQHWAAPFDAAQALWACVQTAAERLLVEIDALAQRYGWSEPQILALTPTRRRAYLQLAGMA